MTVTAALGLGTGSCSSKDATGHSFSATLDSANVLASGDLSVTSNRGRFGNCSVDLGVIATATPTAAPSCNIGGGVCGVNLSGTY